MYTAMRSADGQMETNENWTCDTSLTLGEVLEKYIYEILIHDRSIRYGTKLGYIIAYRNYFINAPVTRRPIGEIMPVHLQMQYNSMTCTAQNIHIINGLLARMYSFLQFHSGIRDISKSVTLPKVPKKGRGIEVWTDSELETITAALPTAPRIRFLTVMLMNTGCRISELLGLKYSDIGDHVLSINKQLVKYTDLTGSGRKGWYDIAPPKSEDSCREIPLSDYVMDEFRLHRKWHLAQMEKHSFRTDFIFTAKTGHFIDKRSETITFRRFYERIGVPYRSFHVYRHTFGTNLCRNGVPIQIASELLGHSSISITAKYYVNVNAQQKIDAVNLLVPKCARHGSNDPASPSPAASITQG